MPDRDEDGWLRWPEALGRVRPDWIDGNQHLNMGYFLVAFDQQTDRLWEVLGLGRALREQGLTTFAAEAWLDYRREMLEGAPLGADSRVLQCDSKRLLVEFRMFHHAEGWVSSTHEALFLCVDVATRKVARWPDEVASRLAAHATGAAPRRLSLRRRP